ncbi:hypothetical protein RJ226_004020 [Enterobacter hormaechei]|nr:hypothetical protein [Enterobacter hormaechei]ELD3190808.1 hypothetical protein [Enterobacter hormaechei]
MKEKPMKSHEKFPVERPASGEDVEALARRYMASIADRPAGAAPGVVDEAHLQVPPLSAERLNYPSYRRRGRE